MPSGMHPNSRKALEENRKKTQFSGERAVEMAKRSAEVRKELKNFIQLDAEDTTDEERVKMLRMVKKRAMQGNIRAFEIYRDTVGLKPVEKVEQTNRDVVLNFGDIEEGDADGDKSL